MIENVARFFRSAEFADLKYRIGGADFANYRLVDPGSKPGETELDRDKRYLRTQQTTVLRKPVGARL
ncbi:BTB/POZ domain-containing protein [Planctomonas psychrotolerans]|uniref:hypothetical protein n=1 Tax=Planctomonas psychrotolerans TaxID=2528712 RepID=UPI00123AFE73|nr:hypothetical protein [Planctomonas psychrotolerans]